MEETIESRNNKIKKWIMANCWQNKINLFLIFIIITALIVRIFFFIQTTNAGQVLWWDEASYMAQSLHYANGIPYDINSMIQRPPAFQYIAAMAMSLGLSEMWIILLFSLLPSVIVVFLTFLLGKSMFNDKVGLIASAFLAVSWNFIFWSNRAQPDFLSICFQLLAIYYFWNMLKTKSNDPNTSVTKQAILAGAWSAISFYFKISSLLIPLSFFLYILIKDKYKIFIKKEYWIYGITYILSMLPYFIWAYYTFGNALAFSTGYSNSVIGNAPFSWAPLFFFQIFGMNIMFFVFSAGCLLCLRALLYLDIIIKKSNLDIRIFLMTLLLVTLSFYIFYIRAIEDRWVFILLPMMSIICGMILDKIYHWIAKHDGWKWIGIILIVGLLSWSAYEQFNYAGKVINGKITSYNDVKSAAEWMRDNSQQNEIIMSISYPQTIYYSKRHVETYSSMNQSQLEEYIKKEHPRYITISIYEPGHPKWIYDWVQNSNKVIPVMAYFQDDAKTKPALIIYQFQY